MTDGHRSGVGHRIRDLVRPLGPDETVDVHDPLVMGTPGDCLIDLLGISLQKVGPGRAWATMRVTEHHLNQQGTAHGGAYFSLADATAGWATFGLLDLPRTFVTLELNGNLMGAAGPGSLLVAIASTVHFGSSTSVVDVRVEQHGGGGGDARDVGRFRCTQMLIDTRRT